MPMILCMRIYNLYFCSVFSISSLNFSTDIFALFAAEVIFMTMYFVGIDISKYKHDCCIIAADNQSIITKFTFKNDKAGFNIKASILL